MPNYDLDITILDGHETRIQRVESGVAEANQSLARVQTGLEYVSESVEQGFKTLGAKMELAIQQNDSIEAKVEGLRPRIEILEKEIQRRQDRRDSIRKASVGLMLAGAGATIAKFGSAIADFLSNLFGG